MRLLRIFAFVLGLLFITVWLLVEFCGEWWESVKEGWRQL